jgi:hypothetical protein
VVVSQTAVGVIAVFAVFIGYVAVRAAAPLVIVVVIAYVVERRAGKWFPTWLKWRVVFKAGVVATLVVTLVLVVREMRNGTKVASDCALAGGSVTKGLVVSNFPSSLVGIRARRVKLTWLTRPKPSIGTRLMFLGEASGTSFVYDLDAKRTTRFPSNAAAMTFLKTPKAVCSD